MGTANVPITTTKLIMTKDARTIFVFTSSRRLMPMLKATTWAMNICTATDTAAQGGNASVIHKMTATLLAT